VSDLILGTCDRGARGELRAALCTTPKGADFVDLRHFERGSDGLFTAGKGLAFKVDEIEPVIALLTKAKAVLSGAKPKHRTVSAAQSRAEIDRQLEEDRRLF
jgi:hypothetical protein